jgi:hypothetical protein
VGDVGPLQLDDGVAAVGQDARVDLGDRRRRQRRVVERTEDPLGREAQLLLDQAADGRRIERPNLVEHLEARVGEGSGEEAGRRSDQLSELHERGAELVETFHDTLGGGGGERAAAPPHHPGRHRSQDRRGHDEAGEQHPPQLVEPEPVERRGVDLERGIRWSICVRSPEHGVTVPSGCDQAEHREAGGDGEELLVR